MRMQSTNGEAITLSKAELRSITGYTCSCKQLQILRQRGFDRVFKSRAGVVLERNHYLAVTAAKQKVTAPSKAPNLAFMRGAV